MFFVGRFITGVGVGISCFALPLYSAEISTASIRGATGSLFQLNVVAPRNEKLDIIFPCKNLPKNGVLSLLFSWNHHWDSPKKTQVNKHCVGFPPRICDCFFCCLLFSVNGKIRGVCLTKGRLGTGYRSCMPDSLGNFPPLIRNKNPQGKPRRSRAWTLNRKKGVGTQLGSHWSQVWTYEVDMFF